MSPSAVDYTGGNHRSVDHSASLDDRKKHRVRDSHSPPPTRQYIYQSKYNKSVVPAKRSHDFDPRPYSSYDKQKRYAESSPS